MFLTLAAKARALMQGRYHVTREDIAALALPVHAPSRAHELLRGVRRRRYRQGADGPRQALGADDRQARVG